MRGLPRFHWLAWSLLLPMLALSTARAANESIAIALTVRGAAEVKQDTAQWAPLAFGAVLNDSDQVRTGPDGFIALAFTDDGTQIKLRPNTNVTVTAQRGDDLALSKKVVIQVGELLSEVKKQKGSMEVNTPTSVASVKGTAFWTMVDPTGGTTVITLEGLVELFNMISGTSVQVPVGQYATSSASGRISARPMSPAIQVPTWNPEEQQPPQQPQEEQQQEEQQPEEPGAPPGEGEAAPSGGGGGGGGGLGIGGAVGSTILDDGKNYQYLSLRPDISIWKFGLGLDLPLYFDPQGGIRQDEWDFKSIDDVINKIYYLRFNKPGDPTYVRIGSLDNITLGYGLIMRDYSNAIEWPKVRRPGLHFQKKIGHFGVEGLVNNLNEFSPPTGMKGPGVLGGRLTFETKFGLPLVFGATVVNDANMFLGIQDQDKDGIPNPFDVFPGKNDKEIIAQAKQPFIVNPATGELDTSAIRTLIDLGALKNILAAPMDFKDSSASVMEYGVDIGIPLIRREKMQLWIYGQYAQILDYGAGITAPGLKFKLGPVSLGAEYRMFGKEFMPEFFNYSYEIDRVVWSEADSTYKKKTDQLADLPTATGYFVDAGVALGNLFNIYASYQAMDFGEGLPSKNIFGSASINPDLVPKLGLAEAYYYQPNADKLFESTDGTVAGYRIGFEMGGGFMLVMDNKSIYRNGNWEKVMTVETQFMF